MDRREFMKLSLGTAVLGLGGCRLLSDRPGAETATLRALRVNHDKCSGCRTCEFVCDEANHKVLVGGAELPGPGDPHRALIHVRSYAEPYYVAWACLGCPDLPCVLACDYYADRLAHRKALHVDPRSGAISLDREWCAGCERCIEACERRGGGVLHWDEASYIAGACHLCGGDPECVKECPTGAIELVAVERGKPLEIRSPEAAARSGVDRLYGGGPV